MVRKSCRAGSTSVTLIQAPSATNNCSAIFAHIFTLAPCCFRRTRSVLRAYGTTNSERSLQRSGWNRLDGDRALLAAMFGVQSNRNAVQAGTNFNRAEAQRLALEASRLSTIGGSSEQIALLSLRSMNMPYTPEGDAALAAAATLDYPLQLFTSTNIVWGAAFSPDSQYVLTGNNDKTTTIWDAQSGQQLRQFIGHTEGVEEVHFLPDEKHILTIGYDRSAIMWEASTGRELYRITVEAHKSWPSFSHDSKYICQFWG